MIMLVQKVATLAAQQLEELPKSTAVMSEGRATLPDRLIVAAGSYRPNGPFTQLSPSLTRNRCISHVRVLEWGEERGLGTENHFSIRVSLRPFDPLMSPSLATRI